ncbi:MAG: hypothetical protein ACXVCI_08965, partial [Bdellovibrionota bacterium]
FAAAPGDCAAATISVAFRYENFPLQIELYNVKRTARDRVAETAITYDLAHSPITKPLRGKIPLGAESERAFAMLVHNTTKDPVYFFAVPHLIRPAASSLGLHFECLCTGKIYKVPPGAFWYRIVRLQTDKTFQAAAAELEHSIIGVSAADANGLYKNQLYAPSNP